jgi:hypothetical protein
MLWEGLQDHADARAGAYGPRRCWPASRRGALTTGRGNGPRCKSCCRRSRRSKAAVSSVHRKVHKKRSTADQMFSWLLVPVWGAAPSLDSGQQLSSFPMPCAVVVPNALHLFVGLDLQCALAENHSCLHGCLALVDHRPHRGLRSGGDSFLPGLLRQPGRQQVFSHTADLSITWGALQRAPHLLRPSSYIRTFRCGWKWMVWPTCASMTTLGNEGTLNE